MSGANKFPKPTESAAPRTNRSLLENPFSDMTRRPDTATLANRNVVTPPSTGFGIARNTPESFPKIPNKMRKKQHQRPATRLAHRVMAMTPLFWNRMSRLRKKGS